MNALHTVTGMGFAIGRIIAKNWIGCHLSIWDEYYTNQVPNFAVATMVCDLNSMSSH